MPKKPRRINPDMLRLAEALEIPDCACSKGKKPELVCHRLGLCSCPTIRELAARQKAGEKIRRSDRFCDHCLRRCDCVTAIPDPCPHILAADHGWSLEKWREFLEGIDAQRPPALRQYLEPPPPREPLEVLDRDSRRDGQEKRLALDARGRRTKETRGLHHPGDLKPEQVPEVGRRATNGMNGETLRDEPLLLDHANKQRPAQPSESNDEQQPRNRAARQKRRA